MIGSDSRAAGAEDDRLQLAAHPIVSTLSGDIRGHH